MIPHRNVELGKIRSSPSPLPLPLLSTRISHSQNAQKRHQKILIQRVADEPNIPVPHPTQKPCRVDPMQDATLRDPFPRIDDSHVVPLVPEAVPGVSVKWAGLIVHGSAVGVLDPMTFEEIAGG